MNPILVVLPYHSGDFEIAKKLLLWIAELGICKPHSLLLCADSAVPQEKMRELMDIARPNFVRVTTMIVTVPASAAWKPNEMFLAAARQVKETCKLPFLWLEADAIPIYAGWLDDIGEAYEECPARFMGSIIKQTGQVGLPAEYLNGVAVYPNDAIEVFEKIATIKDGTQAWDIGSASVVVPRAMNTPLMFHYYGTKELPPVFVSSRAADAPKNHVTLDFVPKEAAIFHRSKGGELIDLLRAKRTADRTVGTGPVIRDVEVKDWGNIETAKALAAATAPNLSAPEIDTPQPQQEKRSVVKSRKVEAAI